MKFQLLSTITTELCSKDAIIPIKQSLIVIHCYQVAGERYVYKFVCDLSRIIGYKPEDVHNYVGLVISRSGEIRRLPLISSFESISSGDRIM